VPEHTPPVQTSLVSQGFPSLQLVPSGSVELEHPLTGSHVPATWHWSLAVQVTGFAPVQAPPEQA
jgi:hypothetical protein